MELHTLSGSLGTCIIVGGYISQVARLVRTHRAEGVSGRTYLLWAVASGLLLVHARGMRSVVFTVLMIFPDPRLRPDSHYGKHIPAVRVARRSRRQHAAERAGLP